MTDYKKLYYLELYNCIPADIPAVVKGIKLPVITDDKESIFKVWLSLPARESRLKVRVLEPGETLEKENGEERKILTKEEIDYLFEKDTHPFTWDDRIFGSVISPERFLENVTIQAYQLGIFLPI